jgi:AraC-like DNA-binding protein
VNSRTISVCFVQAMLEHFDLPHCSRDALLSKAGISPGTVNEGKSRISIGQFSQLSRLAMRTCDDESCGHFPRKVKLGTFQTMAQYVAEAQDLRTAIQRNIAFLSLFETGHSLHCEIDGKFVRYQMQPNPNYPQSTWVFEQHLMLTHRFLSWLVGTPIPLLTVNCHYPPPKHRDEYHYLFFCPTRFDGNVSELIFEQRVLDLPIIKTSEELDSLIRQAPYNLLFMPTRQKSYTEQIRRYIKKSLPNNPSYEQIAASLGLTPQTLRRRLREEGCDYRQIRNELLRDTAIEFLQQTEHSVQEISYRLGFSEPSAFIRSFRNWTGVPPNHYRRQQEAALLPDN